MFFCVYCLNCCSCNAISCFTCFALATNSLDILFCFSIISTASCLIASWFSLNCVASNLLKPSRSTRKWSCKKPSNCVPASFAAYSLVFITTSPCPPDLFISISCCATSGDTCCMSSIVIPLFIIAWFNISASIYKFCTSLSTAKFSTKFWNSLGFLIFVLLLTDFSDNSSINAVSFLALFALVTSDINVGPLPTRPTNVIPFIVCIKVWPNLSPISCNPSKLVSFNFKSSLLLNATAKSRPTTFDNSCNTSVPASVIFPPI